MVAQQRWGREPEEHTQRWKALMLKKKKELEKAGRMLRFQALLLALLLAFLKSLVPARKHHGPQRKMMSKRRPIIIEL